MWWRDKLCDFESDLFRVKEGKKRGKQIQKAVVKLARERVV